MINFITWNIRGLNHPSKQSEIKRLIFDKKLDLISIVETKVSLAKLDSSHRNVAPKWSIVHNYNFSTLGRIWVMWNPNLIDLSVLSSSRQAIHCKISIIGTSISFFSSFIYAANLGVEKQSLWEDINFHAGPFSSSPWLFMGDFNVIPNPNERHGGSLRFFNAWSSHPMFLPSIHKVWSTFIKGTSIFQVVQKLKLLKIALKDNCKKDFSNIDSKLNAVKGELDSCQLDLDSTLTDISLREMERSLIKEYLRLANTQEDMLRQKSRMIWLKLGDNNSSYFHKSFSSRNNKRKIISLTVNSGTIIEDADSIKQEVIHHFKQLLDYSPPSTHSVTDLDKSPGPDGFNATFFQKAWSIVGRSVTKAISEFFTNGKLLSEANNTYIALVPKCLNPNTIHDYRFPDKFISLIQACISSPSFTIALNGEFQGFFKVSILKCALDHFCTMSELTMNLFKSEVFLSGVDYLTEGRIKGLLGIKMGSLPVRYLGVLLISTNLKYSHCSLLIGNITKRITHWSSRSLSYAGWLQLIKAVPVSTQIYWSSIFILPKSVINELNSIFRAFLWSGPEMKATGAKVTWNKVCLPKEAGGLGIPNLELANKAGILKRIWEL
ncbi:uncharacterized protein LOC132270169 [Cornus florida]|uniref:uncharacterized protein LOC132270169 n=1 Tax=Cornus florida TaxID=4283 RepID=UPI00289BD7F6|nr:uncharacterized protein LOC132270169 [Cornus florida]